MSTKGKIVEVELIAECNHEGGGKKVGDKVKVTEGQKTVMQAHGLVAKEKGAE